MQNRTSPEGTLVVYSAWNLSGDPRYVLQRSSYVVATSDGKPAQEVQNHLDRFDEGPQPVSLSPGAYTVTAQSAHFGKVNVPVVIKENQTTFVYLDGYPHPETTSTLQTNLVMLPNGQVVGWSLGAAAK